MYVWNIFSRLARLVQWRGEFWWFGFESAVRSLSLIQVEVKLSSSGLDLMVAWEHPGNISVTQSACFKAWVKVNNTWSVAWDWSPLLSSWVVKSNPWSSQSSSRLRGWYFQSVIWRFACSGPVPLIVSARKQTPGAFGGWLLYCWYLNLNLEFTTFDGITAPQSSQASRLINCFFERWMLQSLQQVCFKASRLADV